MPEGYFGLAKFPRYDFQKYLSKITKIYFSLIIVVTIKSDWTQNNNAI